jgi:hypothetical protein
MKSLFAQLTRRGTKHSRPDSISSRFNSISESNALDSRSGAESMIEELGPSPRDMDLNPLPPIISDGESSRDIRDPQRDIRVSQKIASMSNILREMYSLDLQIFGTENCRPEYEEKRNAMIKEANLLFELIIETLDVWGDEAKCNTWEEDELEIIRNIRERAHAHDPKNYRRARGAKQHREEMRA